MKTMGEIPGQGKVSYDGWNRYVPDGSGSIVNDGVQGDIVITVIYVHLMIEKGRSVDSSPANPVAFIVGKSALLAWVIGRKVPGGKGSA